MVRVLELVRVRRRCGLAQVAGRGIQAQRQVGQAPCHERGVGDAAAAQHAIHVLFDEVHHADARPQVQANQRVAPVEVGQRGDEHQPRQGAGRIDAQQSARGGMAAVEAGLGIVDLGQQLDDALLVQRPVVGGVDLALGAVQELHAQAGFQLVDGLGRGVGSAVRDVRKVSCCEV